MKQSSPKYSATSRFHVSAFLVVSLLCFSVGCGDKEAEVATPASGQANSLTSDDEAVSPADAVAPAEKVASSSGQGSETENIEARSNDPQEKPADSPPGKEPQEATEKFASTNEKTESNEPAPEPGTESKTNSGTKLPDDYLADTQATPLNPQKTVLLDLSGKRILLRAKVCLTEGLLEMLLCPHQTKEHESILSTESQAFTVHTGLLALGCKEGKAARYDSETEEYTPASGQIIDVFLHWVDTDGKLRRERAQNWVRRSRQHYYSAEFKTLPKDLKLVPDGNLRYDDVNQYLFWYGPMTDQELAECLKMSADEKFQAAVKQFHKDGQEKPMGTDWVFVGSGFYEDGDAPKQYLAEGGYMICVANFPMAMLDVATPSDSNGTESLTYEAASEQIPPRGSEVMVELVPRPEKKTDDPEKKPDEPKAESEKAD